ncbi:MAG TPA: aminopeptidase N, partial [Actinopolymorphaceae bacterium]
FVTVVAGPYASLYRTHDGLRLGLHCRQSLATPLWREADELFTVTEQGFDHYHALFGRRYPFGDTYHQVFVPEFNAGAMENAGCVTFRDDLVFRSAVTDVARMDRAATVVHEMAHMWFGDLVTMRWWDDLWLSESFADYMAYRCLAESTRFRGIWTAVALDDERLAYVDDQRPSTHPVSADVADAGQALTNFDSISYAKGCATLRQLAALLGEETFLRGLRSYFDEHAYGNADLGDLLTALGTASGRDLSRWAEVWLREAGVNLLRVRAATTEGRYENVVVEQEAPVRHPVLRPHLLGLGLYDRDGDAVVRRGTVSVEVDGALTSVATLRGARRADLAVPNDLDLAYARIRFDDDSFAALPELLPRLTDSLTRALAWSALDDMVRSAEWPALSYVELAAQAVRSEEDVAIVETLFRHGRHLADLFALPDERARCLAVLTDAATALLDSPPAGGDLQLAAARGLASTAGVDEAPLLRSWLQGRNLPPGLPMDTDLRWEVLRRLVVLGLAGVDEIEDERAGDRTAEGVEHAARCLAARPDPAAKRAAWQLVMTDTEVSNHILEETAAGFWQPEQSEITAEYVERYFDEIPRLADVRTPWMVLSCSARLYPIHAVDRTTLERAERLLRRDDLDPLLRRKVVDNTDTLRRALRAREETARRRADHRPTVPGRL